MPPKRKAMAEADVNGLVSTAPRNAKASKASTGATAPTSKSFTEARAPAKARGGSKTAFKYSNASTLSKKPEILNLQWPNIGDFMDDKDQDMPKKGQTMDAFCFRVSDVGLPISDDAMKMCLKLDKENEKRDQNAKGIHLSSDWNAHAMNEVMANLLKDFDKVVYKKTVSPFKKWAYAEALACSLKMADDDLDVWMNCEDGPGLAELVNMLGLMVLTCFDVLAEHSLLTADSEIKNIGIITLMLLEFLKDFCVDLECHWGTELVRMCDEAGIDLDKTVRKQVNIKKESLDSFREQYKSKQTECKLEIAAAYDGNGYKAFAMKEDWVPADDVDRGVSGGFQFQPDKYWLRWDWELDYAEFKEKHPGGTNYVITKSQKKQGGGGWGWYHESEL